MSFRDMGYDQRVGLSLVALAKTTPGTPDNTIADVAATGAAPGNQNLTTVRADLDTQLAAIDANLDDITAKTNALVGVAHRRGSGIAIAPLAKATPGTPNNVIADLAATGVSPVALGDSAAKASTDTRLASIDANFADVTAKLNELVAAARPLL